MPVTASPPQPQPRHATTPPAVLKALRVSEGVDYGRATTINFAVLGLAQLLHLGNARDVDPVLSWRRAVANRAALAAVCIGALSVVAVIQIPPLARLLQLVPLSGTDWMFVGGLALLPALVGQTGKAIRLRRPRTGGTR